jgi:hypothetical protein
MQIGLADEEMLRCHSEQFTGTDPLAFDIPGMLFSRADPTRSNSMRKAVRGFCG